MIGHLSGKFLEFNQGEAVIDVMGVGYLVHLSERHAREFSQGQSVSIHIHTNLRENALELFGFRSAWEKDVFQLLTTVSGVGPKTALGVMNAIEADQLLAAIVREDRATLTSSPGIGKKTAERLIVELVEKGRKLLATRPGGATKSPTALPENAKKSGKSPATAKIPQQGAEVEPRGAIDLADLWNEAIAALTNLGYREVEAIAAVKLASAKAEEAGQEVVLEKLIMMSLQMISRGA